MLRPGMIQFAKLDLGKPSYCGSGSLACPAPPKEKYYPSIWIDDQDEEIGLPDEGTATIRYKVRRRSTEERDGKKRHSASIDVHSIDTEDPKKSKGLPGSAKKVKLSRVAPGMIQFDSRPRNDNGQFIPPDTGGIDPNSMAAAYGGVAQDKKRRLSLVDRLKGMMAGAPAQS